MEWPEEIHAGEWSLVGLRRLQDRRLAESAAISGVDVLVRFRVHAGHRPSLFEWSRLASSAVMAKVQVVTLGRRDS